MAGPIRIAILADARPAVKGMHTVEDSAKGMGSKLGGIGKTVAGGFAGLGAAFAVGAAVDGFKEVIGQAADLSAAVGATKQVFGTSAGDMIAWSKTAATTIGLSQAEALNATKTFGGFFTATGMNTKQADAMSKSWVTMAGNLAAFGDMPTSDAIDAVTGALRGELDPLQKYIPTISAASIQQKAMAMTGKKSAAALTQQDKAAAINALMMDSVANKAGAAERAQGGYAVQMGKLKAQVKDGAAAIGGLFLPVLTGGMTFINNTAIPAMKKLGGFLGPKLKQGFGAISSFKPPKAVVSLATSSQAMSIVDNLKKGFLSLGPLFGKIIAVVMPIIKQVGATLGAAFNKALPQIKTILGTIGTIVGQVFTVIKTVVMDALGIIQFLWKNFGANILGFISGAFAAVVTVLRGAFTVVKGIFDVIIGLLTGDWSRAWDGVKAIVSGAWTMIQGVFMQLQAIVTLVIGVVGKVLKAGWGLIKTAAAATWHWIVGLVVGAWNGIKAGVSAAVSAVAAAIGAVWNWIKTTTAAVWNGIKNGISSAISAVSSFIRNGVSFWKSVIANAWSAIKNAVSSAWTGIKNAVSTGISNVVSFVRELPGKIKSAVSGAATWLVNTGRDIVNGIIEGIKSVAGNIGGKIREIVKGALGAAGKIFGFSSSSAGDVAGQSYAGAFASSFTAAASRTLSKAGQSLVSFLQAGMVQGMSGGKMAATVKTLNAKIKAAFSGATEARLLKAVSAAGKALAPKAAKWSAVVASIAAKGKEVADLRSARADIVSSVADSIRQSFSLVDQAAQDGDTSVRSILDRSGKAVAQARTFAAQLATLRANGLSPAVLQELAAAGPEAGAATARSLANATSQQIKELNANYRLIAASGIKAGDIVGGSLYDAGISAGEGFIAGLRTKQAAIEDQMRKIAQRLKGTVQTALSGTAKSTAPAKKSVTKTSTPKATAAYAATSAGTAPIYMTVNTGVIVDKRGLVDTVAAAVNEVAAQMGRPVKLAIEVA